MEEGQLKDQSRRAQQEGRRSRSGGGGSVPERGHLDLGGAGVGSAARMILVEIDMMIRM